MYIIKSQPTLPLSAGGPYPLEPTLVCVNGARGGPITPLLVCQEVE